MRAAKFEPVGKDTVSFAPSSETMLELRSREPLDADLVMRPSVTRFQLRCSVAPSVMGAPAFGAAEVRGAGACCGAGSECGTGAETDAGCGAVRGAGAGRGAGAAAGLGAGAGRGVGATGCGAGAGAETGATIGADAGAGAGTAGAGAGAATRPGTESAATCRSRFPILSASDSSVRSDSGRAILVSAISRTRRWLVAVRISLEASPRMVSTRAIRSAEPNAAASDERFASSSGDAAMTLDGSPTTAVTYTSRMRDASSRANCSRSRPSEASRETSSKSDATSLSAIAFVTLPRTAPFASPKRSWVAESVIAPSPKTETCSSEVRASRIPPRAWRTISSSAASS